LQLISRAAKLMKLKAFLKKARGRTTLRAFPAQKYPFGGFGLLYHTPWIKAGYSGDPLSGMPRDGSERLDRVSS